MVTALRLVVLVCMSFGVLEADETTYSGDGAFTTSEVKTTTAISNDATSSTDTGVTAGTTAISNDATSSTQTGGITGTSASSNDGATTVPILESTFSAGTTASTNADTSPTETGGTEGTTANPNAATLSTVWIPGTTTTSNGGATTRPASESTVSVETTASTNSAPTTSESVVVTDDPCFEACPANLECFRGAGNDVECLCNEGFVLDDGVCVKVCEAEEFTFNNAEVYYDVKATYCENSTLYPPNNANYSASFGQSQVGTTMTANITCSNTTCEDNVASMPIGYTTCQSDGKYSTPTWINCGVTNPSPEQQLSTSVVATSDPNQVDGDTVSATVEVMANVSAQEDIPTETADDFMAVTNNLLRSNGSGAQAEVEANSELIIQSVQDTTQNVVLEPTEGGYDSYENVQSDIAMGVAQVPVTTKTAREVRAVNKAFSYVLGEDASSNLANAGVELTYGTDPPSGQAYISATPSGSERLSFVVYTSIQQLFPDSKNFNILSNNIVFGVNTSNDAAGENYTMQFPIVADAFNSDKELLDCIIWDITTSKWASSSSCSKYVSNGTFASCTCTKAGQYTIRSIDIQPTNDELSAGAIAGIVIGSLAGVAIIGGLVYYFGFRKKKGQRSVGSRDNESVSSEL